MVGKRLSRRELTHIVSSIQVLDREIMCAFVVKEMEEKETIHLNYYLARQELWTAWKNDSGKLELLLQFFHSGFFELFNRHAKGKGDKFSRLLV